MKSTRGAIIVRSTFSFRCLPVFPKNSKEVDEVPFAQEEKFAFWLKHCLCFWRFAKGAIYLSDN